MAKVGRPREPVGKISKWGRWKRWQRESPGGGRCAKCGIRVSGRNAHRDHKDGNTANMKASNRQLLCAKHHMSKGRRTGQI